MADAATAQAAPETQAQIPPRVAVAEAVLAARRGVSGGRPSDVRTALDVVREQLQQVTDARVLRELLSGLAGGGVSEDPPPEKATVSSLESLVNVGTKITGTPTEREKALRDELDGERKARQGLEKMVFDLRDELHDRRHDQRTEQREDSIAATDIFSRLFDTFDKYRSGQGNQDDPFRTIGQQVLLGFMNQKPSDQLEQAMTTIKLLRELGFAQPQMQQSNDPLVLRLLLEHELGKYRVQQESESRTTVAKATTDRVAAMVPTLGVLATAALSRFLGPDQAAEVAHGLLGEQDRAAADTPAAAGQAPAAGPATAAQGQRLRVVPNLYKCGQCGFEIITREPIAHQFPCPSCRTELNPPAHEATP